MRVALRDRDEPLASTTAPYKIDLVNMVVEELLRLWLKYST
jgi:hypothetical protein